MNKKKRVLQEFENEISEEFIKMCLEDKKIETEKDANKTLERLWDSYCYLVKNQVISWDNELWLEMYNKLGLEVVNTKGSVQLIKATTATKVLYRENKN